MTIPYLLNFSAHDLQQMAEAGVNCPHYHHLKWFRDYLLFQRGDLFESDVPLSAITDPLPDECAWQHHGYVHLFMPLHEICG